MTWIPSWLPQLPSLNFAVPSSVQGRFISFLLKKSFGHLFKPGQLDSNQVDAQIGSGYVQVNDLELDAEVLITFMLMWRLFFLPSQGCQCLSVRPFHYASRWNHIYYYRAYSLAQPSVCYTRPHIDISPSHLSRPGFIPASIPAC